MLATTTLPTGDTTTYTYDGYGRLGTVVSRKPDNTLLAEYDYTRRLDGKITHVVEKDAAGVKAARDYAFDELGRLTHESYDDVTAADNDWVEQLVLDIWGNRTQKTIAKSHNAGGSVNVTFTDRFDYDFGLVNTRDQLKTERHYTNGTLADSTAYAYDSNGALVSAVKHTGTVAGAVLLTTVYENDLRDRLRRAIVTNPDSSRTEESYLFDAMGIKYSDRILQADANGNLLSDTATAQLTDSMNPTGYAQVMEELVAGVLTATYVHGLEALLQNRAGASSYYLFDGHSGVRQVLSPAHAQLASYLYSAFGVLVASTGTLTNPLKYRGEAFNSTLSQYYLRARFYNPSTGAFTRMDPLLGTGSNPVALHRYMYAAANPLTYGDPSGREFSVGGALSSMAIGGLLGGFVSAGLTAASGGSFKAVAGSFLHGLALGAAAGLGVYSLMALGASMVGASAAVGGIEALLSSWWAGDPWKTVLMKTFFGMTFGAVFAFAGGAALRRIGKSLEPIAERIRASAPPPNPTGLQTALNESVSAWGIQQGGFRLAKVGNYWIKEVDPSSSLRGYATTALEAQLDGLRRLGPLAPEYVFSGGRLAIRDAGQFSGSLLDFFQIKLVGSIRLGTLFNDIWPRNIGSTGLIFDPSLHPVHEAFWGIMVLLGESAAGIKAYTAAGSDE